MLINLSWQTVSWKVHSEVHMKEEAVRDLDSYLNENEKVENFIEETF